MKFKEIKPGMVVHCPKKEDAEALLEYLRELGYRWCNHERIEINPMKDNWLGSSTVYIISTNGTDNFVCGDTMENYGTSSEFSDLIEPDDSSMTAVEVLEWLEQHGGTQVAEKVFGFDSDGYVVDTGNVLDIYSPQEIVDKITAYEAAKKEPKPVEVEWVNLCRIIQTKDDGTKKVVYEENLKAETPFDTDPDLREQTEAILKKYTLRHDGRYIAVIEDICRVKESES